MSKALMRMISACLLAVAMLTRRLDDAVEEVEVFVGGVIGGSCGQVLYNANLLLMINKIHYEC